MPSACAINLLLYTDNFGSLHAVVVAVFVVLVEFSCTYII